MANEHIAVVTAAVKYFKKINPEMYAKLEQLRKDIVKEFGLKTRIISKVGGIYVTHKMKKEMKRLAEGQTWEPPTYYEHNFEPGPLLKGKHKGEKCKFVKALSRA